MPDTRGQDGQEHFAAYADAMQNKSSSNRFSTYEETPGTVGDGPIFQETRGEPSSLALDVDFAPDEPPAKKKKGK
jgi:hypothetical protein